MQGGLHVMLSFGLTFLLICFIKGALSEITDIRLVDGANSLEGRLELKYNGSWGTVCDDYFYDEAARVVCATLGHPNPAATAWGHAYFGEGTEQNNLDTVIVCGGTETSLNDCWWIPYLSCSHSEDVSVDCDFSPDASTVFVRLVGGSTANEGRVEIIHRNSLGTICGHNWDDNDAKVICSMLGYQRGGSQAAAKGRFAPGKGRIWVDNVNCAGTEGLIYDCPTTNGWIVNTCSHADDAGVICSTGTPLDDFILVTDSYHDEIYRMDLSTFGLTEINHNKHFHPIAVGCDLINQRMYWSDVVSKKIKTSNLDGSLSGNLLNLPKNAIPDGLAIDPISRNLFFTDTGLNIIVVMSLETVAYKLIITSNLDQPRGIALHPDKGYIFWTDWGVNPKIERANMDGTGRLTLISSGLGWPNGIAIDYSADRIYWADAKTDKIEKADFNGQNREMIYSGAGQHAFGLVLVDDYIYYTDWTERYVMRINKNGKDNIRVGPPIFGRLNEITACTSDKGIYAHPPNGCTVARGGCSHICVPMPGIVTACLCPYPMTIGGDGKTCVRKP